VQQYGPWWSWGNTSRALIFARNASGVVDIASFQRLMRYNDYQHDPLGREGCGIDPPYSAVNAIAARADLNPEEGDYPFSGLGHMDIGALDAKIAAASLTTPSSIVTVLQGGPTYDQQPVFAWSTTAPDIAALTHEGQPDVWAFPWIALQAATADETGHATLRTL